MTILKAAADDYSEIDIYGSQECYEMVMDVLYDYSEDHLTLHKSYRNSLELVRRAVWRNYGEATYLKYEEEIRHELFHELVSFTEFLAIENLRYWYEFEGGIRKFHEIELELFEALDCLYANCVDLSSKEIGGDDNVH
jgi:hypothetical protein